MGYAGGKWIYYHTGDRKRYDSLQGNPSPYFRKTFVCKDKIKSAVMYASCLGVFSAFINGKKVSPDRLAPGRVDYSLRLPVVKYDITELLGENNAVGVICGDGWALGCTLIGKSYRRNCYSDEIYFYSVIEIEYENGKTDRIVSDRSWKACDGCVRYSDLNGGEMIDAHYFRDGFSEPQFNDFLWKNVSEDSGLFSKTCLLTEGMGVFAEEGNAVKPVKINTDTGVYDFGRKINGFAEFSAEGSDGDRVFVYYSDTEEFTEDTNFADIFILSGTEQMICKPVFSVHGFRYIKVVHNLKISDLSAVEVVSGAIRSGDFYCSDTRINENFVNHTRLSSRSLFGGTGGSISYDKALFNMYSFDASSIYEKYLSDIRDAQLPNGFIPAVVPVAQYMGRKCMTEDAGAMLSVVKIVSLHFSMYGKVDVLIENLPMCKAVASYIEENYSNNLLLAELFGYMSNLCMAAGDSARGYYTKRYSESKELFRGELSDFHTEGDLQEDYIRAFEAGLLSADDVRKPLVNTVKRDDEPASHLLSVLCDIGERELAYKLVTENPSKFKNTWDYTWLYSSVLGIKIPDISAGAGFKKVVIEPCIDFSDNIKKAGGSCMTPYGKLSVYWEKTDDLYTCCLTVPFEIDATCRFSGFKVINQKCSRETYVFMLRKNVKQGE